MSAKLTSKQRGVAYLLIGCFWSDGSHLNGKPAETILSQKTPVLIGRQDVPPPLLTHLTRPFHGKDVSEAPNSRRGHHDSGQCLFLKSFMSGPVAQILQESTLAAPRATGQRLPLARSVSRHRPTRQSASPHVRPPLRRVLVFVLMKQLEPVLASV